MWFHIGACYSIAGFKTRRNTAEAVGEPQKIIAFFLRIDYKGPTHLKKGNCFSIMQKTSTSPECLKVSVPPHIAELVPYPPGKPLDELEREYGITGSIKLASNENPLGPSPLATNAIRSALDGLNRYPDGSGYYLKKKLSEKFALPFAGLVLGNGSNEIIELCIRTFVQPGDEVILPAPSFLVYRLAVQAVGGKVIAIPLADYTIDLRRTAEAVSSRTKVVFINNPNNPTGTVIRKAEFESFLAALPVHVIVVLDEAYIEFVQDHDTPNGFHYTGMNGPCVVVARTFSKAYGLAGLRVGFGAMPPELADYLHRVRQPFNVGTLAQVAALAALDDHEFLQRTQRTVADGLAYLYREIAGLGLRYVPTQANFFLIEVPVDARQIYEAMLRQGVIIRAMNAYGMPHHIRISAGLPEENQRFIGALKTTLSRLEGCG
jgi:histidinol-phosphate aminotransferase